MDEICGCKVCFTRKPCYDLFVSGRSVYKDAEGPIILEDYLLAGQAARRFSGETELRAQENTTKRIVINDGTLLSNAVSSMRGVSARVRKNGSYGFASDSDYSESGVERVLALAAKNAGFLDERKSLNKQYGYVRNAYKNAHGLALTESAASGAIMDALHDLDAHIKMTYPKLKSRRVLYNHLNMEKRLLTSDNVYSHTRTPRSLIIVSFYLETDDGATVDLYDIFGGYGYFGDHFGEGTDHVKEQLAVMYEDLCKKAEGIYAKGGRHTVVLDADLAGILAHEAIGHTVEADLVLGGSVAGPNLGKQVASELVTLVDYAHEAFGQPCPVPITVDDEGTVAKDAVLIENGQLVGFMHNRETALHFDHEPLGNARAYEFTDEPLVRMRNTCIVPGKDKLSEMIASVDDGYYLVKSGNGQADTTSEFMFGITKGFEIKHGKIGRALRDATVSGVAFDVLKTVSMISDDLTWSCSGMCGKKQMIPVGMGGPAIKCELNIGGRA